MKQLKDFKQKKGTIRFVFQKHNSACLAKNTLKRNKSESWKHLRGYCSNKETVIVWTRNNGKRDEIDGFQRYLGSKIIIQ